jgi:hypothetical protein
MELDGLSEVFAWYDRKQRNPRQGRQKRGQQRVDFPEKGSSMNRSEVTEYSQGAGPNSGRSKKVFSDRTWHKNEYQSWGSNPRKGKTSDQPPKAKIQIVSWP